VVGKNVLQSAPCKKGGGIVRARGCPGGTCPGRNVRIPLDVLNVCKRLLLLAKKMTRLLPFVICSTFVKNNKRS